MATKRKLTTKKKSVRPRVMGLYGGHSHPPKGEGIYVSAVLERKARSRVNKKLEQISRKFYPTNIPWGVIMDAAISEGFDGAMITGIDDNKPGKVHVNIGGNTWLTVMWHLMPSGSYEITAYVS
jgi:hypothetical protein